MGPLVGESNFSCSKCKNPVAYRHELLSKAMRVKSGPAYLFSNAMNVVVGPKMDREMLSGIFTVADIWCSQCGEVLGWKYIKAREVRDKLKEGKYVLERAKLVKEYH